MGQPDWTETDGAGVFFTFLVVHRQAWPSSTISRPGKEDETSNAEIKVEPQVLVLVSPSLITETKGETRRKNSESNKNKSKRF